MTDIAFLKYPAMGALLGLTAGISPGPLLTLVLTETLRHNRKEGIKIAMAPLITDLPIILVTLLVFSKLSQLNIILGLISLLGGLFVAWLGYETITIKGSDIDVAGSTPQSLRKGISANFLSPHPYLFWLTVGTPLALNAYKTSLPAAILFFVSFYIFLVGSKICIAFIAEQSKTLLNNKAYLLTMRILGIALLIFSLYFFYDGIKYINIL